MGWIPLQPAHLPTAATQRAFWLVGSTVQSHKLWCLQLSYGTGWPVGPLLPHRAASVSERPVLDSRHPRYVVNLHRAWGIKQCALAPLLSPDHSNREAPDAWTPSPPWWRKLGPPLCFRSLAVALGPFHFAYYCARCEREKERRVRERMSKLRRHRDPGSPRRRREKRVEPLLVSGRSLVCRRDRGDRDLIIGRWVSRGCRFLCSFSYGRGWQWRAWWLWPVWAPAAQVYRSPWF
jgi:hypothetical protein